MANQARTQRRKDERSKRKAQRKVPPEVRARIAEIQQGTGNAAAAQARAAAEEVAQAPPVAAVPDPPEPEAPPGPMFDLPPGLPSDLPPSIARALEQATAAAQEEENGGGGARTAPQSRRPAKSRDKKMVELEKELAVLLTLPAPFFEGAGDEFCAMHFTMQGPLLAMQLTSYAETNPATAALLERIVSAGGFAVVAMALISYSLPPMLHHGLPAPEGLRRMYHVPSKPHRHDDGEPHEGEVQG